MEFVIEIPPDTASNPEPMILVIEYQPDTASVGIWMWAKKFDTRRQRECPYNKPPSFFGETPYPPSKSKGTLKVFQRQSFSSILTFFIFQEAYIFVV